MRARVIKIGNSQGLRIPKPILEQTGIMEDVDYKYCYRNLLIETKEWYNTLKNLEAYMVGK